MNNNPLGYYFRHTIFDGFPFLRCFEYDLTIFRKCLSVSVSACMSPKFCEHCISRTNAQKLMKLYIQFHLDIIWCWLDFCVYCSTSNAAMENFPPNFGILISLILMPRISPNLLSNIHILRKYVDWQKIFGANQLTGGAGRLYFPRISSYL